MKIDNTGRTNVNVYITYIQYWHILNNVCVPMRALAKDGNWLHKKNQMLNFFLSNVALYAYVARQWENFHFTVYICVKPIFHCHSQNSVVRWMHHNVTNVRHCLTFHLFGRFPYYYVRSTVPNYFLLLCKYIFNNIVPVQWPTQETTNNGTHPHCANWCILMRRVFLSIFRRSLYSHLVAIS